MSTKFVNLFLLGLFLALLPQVSPVQVEAKSETIPVTLLVKSEQKLQKMDLEEYLIGVVAAEMPAQFEIEALKAQAVAARTIAVSRMLRYGGRGTKWNKEADFSDDPNDSQAWYTSAQLRVKWGEKNFNDFYDKVREAVEDTEGIIMEYDGKPIDAVFHSTCGIGTESAVNLWGGDVPYLRGVSCGMDEDSPKYSQEKFFSYEKAASILNVSEKEVKKVKITKHTSEKRVATVSCGSTTFTGTVFRTKLGLNSTAFEIDTRKDGIYILTKGNGHGIGMCQYGANGFAKNKGWKYKKILKHYYRGIDLTKIKY